jgi:hypothetical protein
VIESKVLRKILKPKRDEVTGGRRELHNEEIRELYTSPSVLRMIKLRRVRWTVHAAGMGINRNVYRLFIRKPEGRRPLGRPRRRWVDNIRMDLGNIGLSLWTGLIWLRIGTYG